MRDKKASMDTPNQTPDSTTPAAAPSQTPPASPVVQPVQNAPAPTAVPQQVQTVPATAPARGAVAAPEQVVVGTPVLTADEQAAIAQDKIFAFFSYLSILFLVPMFVRPKSKFCQFHARQGMVLFVLWLLITNFGWITRFISPAIAATIYSIDGLVLFIFIGLGLWNVSMGKFAPLPLFGAWVEKVHSKMRGTGQAPAPQQ